MVKFKLRIWAFTSWNQITTSEVHTTAIRRNKAIGGSRLPVGLWSNTDQVLERKSKISSRKSQGKMLLTSCPYIGKSLTIFWPKLTKCYWHLVNILEKKKVDYIFDPNRQNIIDSLSICWRKLEYILTQIGKILLISSRYIGESSNIFWPKLAKYYWHLVNILAKAWTYFDSNWEKLDYILTQIGKILLTTCQYVGGTLNIFWPKLAKYFWNLVNILAIAWTYFDFNW